MDTKDLASEIYCMVTDAVSTKIIEMLRANITPENEVGTLHASFDRVADECIKEVMGDINERLSNTDPMKEYLYDRLIRLDAVHPKKNEIGKVRYRKYSTSKHDSLSINTSDLSKRYIIGSAKYGLMGIVNLFLEGHFDDRLMSAMIDYYGGTDLVNAFMMSLPEDRYYDMCDSFISAALKDDDMLKRYFGIERTYTYNRTNDKLFG